jgi:hypothetical protein
MFSPPKSWLCEESHIIIAQILSFYNVYILQNIMLCMIVYVDVKNKSKLRFNQY